MTLETAIMLAGLGVTVHGAFLHFAISVLVRLGKLETRVNRTEQDCDNLGELYRNQKLKNERKAS